MTTRRDGGAGPAWPATARDVEARMKRFPWRAVFLILGALFLLNLVRGLFLVVQAGERAVIFSKISGTRPYQLGEGMHLRLPFVWEATKYDVRSRTYTMSGGGAEGHDPNRAASATQVPDDSLQALTADGLPVTMDLSVRFHVDPDRVWRLHQEIGPDFVDKVIRPQSRSITRMAVAQYPVVDVYSGRRQAIIEQIQRELRLAFQKSHLILDEVLLRDVRFPDPFQAAIERKQVAQQEAQQMTFEVERARSEKQQRIVEAEGEAEAIRIKADALAQNPQLVSYEYVKRLPGDVSVVITDSRNSAIVNLGAGLNAGDAGAAAAAARQTPQAQTQQQEGGGQP